MKKYTAPWSTSLIIISSLATLICVGVAVSLYRERPALGGLASTYDCLRRGSLHDSRLYRHSRRDSGSAPALDDPISVGWFAFWRGRAGGDASEHSHIWQRRLVLLHWLVLQQGARCISRLCYRPASGSCSAFPSAQRRRFPLGTGRFCSRCSHDHPCRLTNRSSRRRAGVLPSFQMTKSIQPAALRAPARRG